MVTASIGIASISTAHADFDDLIAAADHALYTAKGSGRNYIAVAPDDDTPPAAAAPALAMAS